MVPSVDTATAVPERSHEQRLRALRRANEIRSKRAQLKRDLKAGKTKIEALLLDPPDYVMSAKAFDMILAVPKYGRVKANKILTQCRISPSKTIGGLSQRQRGELVGQLRRYSAPRSSPALRRSGARRFHLVSIPLPPRPVRPSGLALWRRYS